jgi:hypothetical protein
MLDIYWAHQFRDGDIMITEQTFLEIVDYGGLNQWVEMDIMGNLETHHLKKDVDCFPIYPPYDKDYNAMHRVIEKMQHGGWRWESSFDGSAYYFKFWAGLSGYDPGWSLSADLRLAVYLAAGRALGRIE